MARPLRIEYPGAVYHVTSRGNARNAIFVDDGDRQAFLKILQSVVIRFGWLCHAYCLMGNHYHLLIETPEANLSRSMRQLNGVYTQTYNRRHGLVGHLLQGRFKAILVEKESYLLQLCRYIVRNPMAAGLTETPEEWPWSSFLATAGLVALRQGLSVDWILSQFGESRHEAQARYRAFVSAGSVKDRPWEALSGRTFLGSEEFIDRLGPLLSERLPLAEIPKEQRFVARPPLPVIFENAQVETRAGRAAKMYQAHAGFGYTLKEIADFLGIHYATVSRAVKRVEMEMLDCKT